MKQNTVVLKLSQRHPGQVDRGVTLWRLVGTQNLMLVLGTHQVGRGELMEHLGVVSFMSDGLFFSLWLFVSGLIQGHQDLEMWGDDTCPAAAA